MSKHMDKSIEEITREVRKELAQEHNWAENERHWRVMQDHAQSQREHDKSQREHWSNQKWYWRLIMILGFLAVVVNGLAAFFAK